MPLNNPTFTGGCVARYTRGSTQAIPSGTATIVNFDTLVFDNLNCVTTGASWVFTAKIAGVYSVGASIRFASSTYTAGNELNLQVNKNGSLYAYLSTHRMSTAETSVPNNVYGSTQVQLAVGETISVLATQQEGADRNIAGASSVNYIDIRLDART